MKKWSLVVAVITLILVLVTPIRTEASVSCSIAVGVIRNKVVRGSDANRLKIATQRELRRRIRQDVGVSNKDGLHILRGVEHWREAVDRWEATHRGPKPDPHRYFGDVCWVAELTISVLEDDQRDSDVRLDGLGRVIEQAIGQKNTRIRTNQHDRLKKLVVTVDASLLDIYRQQYSSLAGPVEATAEVTSGGSFSTTVRGLGSYRNRFAGREQMRNEVIDSVAQTVVHHLLKP